MAAKAAPVNAQFARPVNVLRLAIRCCSEQCVNTHRLADYLVPIEDVECVGINMY